VHGNATLGGPVWLFATFIVLLTVLLGGFVFIDSLRPARSRARGRGREPLWMYTAGEGTFLAILVFAQFAKALPISAAVAALSAPFALALGFAYLLRVVYPKADPGSGGGSDFVSGGDEAAGATPGPQQ
jgi:hypothetical protein